jgi:hypothetical protein
MLRRRYVRQRSSAPSWRALMLEAAAAESDANPECEKALARDGVSMSVPFAVGQLWGSLAGGNGSTSPFAQTSKSCRNLSLRASFGVNRMHSQVQLNGRLPFHPCHR